jgi:DNA-binding transcriptional LysR family regulator
VDWHDLRYVLAVAQTGTLAGAARVLGVDHTTVGRRVLALEKALKTRLFERTPTGLRVTPAGELALARARDIEEQMLALEREVVGQDARPEGPVRITAIDAFFDGFLIPRLGAFYARYPHIEVTLVSDMRLLDLSRREADVGIRFMKPSQPRLMARKLGRSASAFYASRAYIEERGNPTGGWEGHLFVGMPRGGPAFIEGIYNQHGPNARFVLRVNSVGHVVSAARAGVGIGLIPCITGDTTPELRRVTPPVLLDDLWAVSHVDTRSSARVRALVDFLAEIIRENARKLAPRS